MKRYISLLVLGVFILSSYQVNAKGLEWLTDFEKAKQLAAEKNLPIFVDFTGSDWCSWCKKLVAEVFDKNDFQVYAKENLILFLADFPRFKSIPKKMKQQNESLAVKYGIRGFPTILLLDAQGKVLGQTGYRRGGADAYIKHLEQLLEKGRKEKSQSK